jgi:hypothetical protein
MRLVHIPLPVWLLSLSLVTQAQEGTRVERAALPQVIHRSAHERTLQSVVEVTQPDGSLAQEVRTVVELATGMHYLGDQGGMAGIGSRV